MPRVRDAMATFFEADAHQCDFPLFAAVGSTSGGNAQKAEFAESCKAYLIVAPSLVVCRGAAFALRPFMQRSAFRKTEQPYSETCLSFITWAASGSSVAQKPGLAGSHERPRGPLQRTKLMLHLRETAAICL